MIRIAAYQAAAKASFQDRKRHILEVLEKADQQEVDFLCLPEGFLTGYYEERNAAEANSLEINGSEFQSLLRQIAHYKVTIIVGFNERKDNQIFDSAAVIEKGQLLGVQRKHYLYHNYFASGSDFKVYTVKDISFGITICLDTNYFEPARLLALQGASILFSPMCNKVPADHPFAQRPPYYSHFIARAHENRCWLVSADWIWANNGELTCPGHSVIYDPDGCEIARSEEGKEQFLIADIPHNRLFHQKGRRVHGSKMLTQEIEKLTQANH